jgi:hypothetical protein
LISRGHPADKFFNRVRDGGYTYDQFTTMHEAAMENRKADMRENLFNMRVAQHANGKDFQKYIKQQDMVQERSESKTVTKNDLDRLKLMGMGK